MENNRLFDTSLSFDERARLLAESLTLEEKFSWMGSFMPGCERLGIPPFGLGGEAAHGVEGRNDQFFTSEPDITTSFPQPIGMSATWDPDLIRQCGEVVGTEARVVSKRRGRRGLSRWAPTVDLLRDPRWGRNEEGYGEDPVLTGKMAGAYIRGMQGDDPKYIRCAATLKHFYGNNTEAGRAWKNATIDPRNRYELYLEPFRRCIENARVQGVMTAYNRINGKVGILNSEVRTILKDEYGLTHAVGDGGALSLVVSGQHRYGSAAEAIADALHAGVDGMSDGPAYVEPAAREAFELGLITEEDMDRAIIAKAKVMLRLGLLDGDASPYSSYTESDICTPEADALALRCAEENLVLLKNDGILPLDRSESAALIGPWADAWYKDWYGGAPNGMKTIREGMSALNIPCDSFDGWNRVRIMFGDKGITIADNGQAYLSESPDTFVMEDWGEEYYTFRCVRTGKYLGLPHQGQAPEDSGYLYAAADEPFNWFVLELFHLEKENGCLLLTNCFHRPVTVADDKLISDRDHTGTPVTLEIIEDGIERAAQIAARNPAVILAVGQCPMIPAKEERDRHTLLLPEHQRKLIKAVHSANPRAVLVLCANYPHTLPNASEHLPAIMLSATGCQQFGTAVVNGLYGICAPAGRLNMTWVRSDDQLPDINDYDIIQGKRTYRYFEGDVLYPFGYGLTYTSFSYRDLGVTRENNTLTFTFTVENTGKAVSDEVAQIYASAPTSRVKKPLRQLLAFVRLHAVQPGEKRAVTLTAPVDELRFYDVISRRLMVEAGQYRFFAGGSSADEAISAVLDIPGETVTPRNMAERIPAECYDESNSVAITEGTLGFACVGPRPGAESASVTYRDCRFSTEDARLSLRLISETGGRVTVLLNGKELGTWSGDTRTSEHNSFPAMDRYAYLDIEARARERRPVWEDIDFPCPETEAAGTLVIRMDGEIRLSFFKTKPATGARKIRTGIAN